MENPLRRVEAPRHSPYEQLPEPGTFHGWGFVSAIITNDHDDNVGVNINSRAIVEFDDGAVVMVEPQHIRFIDRVLEK